MPRSWARLNALSIASLPLALVFLLLTAARRLLFRMGILNSTKINVPIIVVGNITVGGTGKTPAVIAIANALKDSGFTPGVITRGYLGDGTEREVTDINTSSEVGDEAILISHNVPCPVWVGPKRVNSALQLLKKYQNINVIISDDGLQHYELERDMEIVVIDGDRKFGNGLLLPSGPLREPTSRIRTCDLVLINGTDNLNLNVPTISMKLVGETFHKLSDPTITCNAADLSKNPVTAIAGIGNPERFFQHLNALGLRPNTKPFPDHHEYSAADLNEIEHDIVIMTEKDAVKCRDIGGKECWFLPVSAQFEGQLIQTIIEKLKSCHG
ncbi:MAG: tetraacyldisaccharide 4'-kinase [Burkholderiales bacterium]|nr:tetraacyldisaccharide 4'-kinase [Burkholderiales bacterium]OUT78772.1 MAG: tetraacyldisaccharide 4'-kinase [Betaproteobacteria bacterium TMED22]